MAPRAKLVVEMTAQDAALFKSLQKQQAAQKQVEQGYGKIGRTSKKAGQQAQESFGNRQINNLQRMAVSMAAVTTGIQLAAQAMRFYQQETNKAIQTTKSLENARASLTQIARSAQDLEAMERLANQIALDTGVDRQTATGLVFAGRSVDFDPQQFARLRPVFEADTLKVAEDAAAVAENFERSISPLEALDIATQAARSSRARVPELLLRAPIASAGGQQAGASPAETLAALGQLSKTQGLERAGTLLQSFGVRLGLSEQFGGRGFVGGVEALQAASAEDRQKFLGESQEANVAFKELSKILAEVTSETQKANKALQLSRLGVGPSEAARNIALNPNTLPGRRNLQLIEANQAAALREIQTEQSLAERGLGQQAAIDRTVAGTEAANLGGFSAFGAQTLGDAAASLQTGEETTEAAAQIGGALGGGGTAAGGGSSPVAGGTSAVIGLLNRIANASERAAGQTRTLEAPDVD